MPISRPKYMAVDYCEADDVKVLNVIPVGKECSVGNISLLMECFSLPDREGVNSWQYLGPAAFLEYDAVALFVPFNVAATYSPPITVDGGPTGVPRLPATPGEWDYLFRRLIFEQGIDGNEYYGANPDGVGNTYDPVRNVWIRRGGVNKAPANTHPAAFLPTSNTPEAIQAAIAAAIVQLEYPGDTQDEPIARLGNMGPKGVQRLWDIPRFLHSNSIASVGKGNLPLISGLLSQAGLLDVFFSDSLRIDEMVNLQGPGFVLVGIQRWHTLSAPGHATVFSQTEGPSGSVAVSDRLRALNALMAGDSSEIKRLVIQDTTDSGDYMRSLLFGGDVNIVSKRQGFLSNVFDVEGIGNPLRANTIMYGLKGQVTMGSPYSLLPNL